LSERHFLLNSVPTRFQRRRFEKYNFFFILFVAIVCR
jgi:hypothetical protein